MIIVDDCCHVRNLYERIFPGIKTLDWTCFMHAQGQFKLFPKKTVTVSSFPLNCLSFYVEMETLVQKGQRVRLAQMRSRQTQNGYCFLGRIVCLRKLSINQNAFANTYKRGVFRTYLLGVEQKRMNVYTDILIDRSSVVSWTRTRDNCNELCIVCLELQTTNKQIDLES